MSQFINQRDQVVTEALDGLIALSGGALSRLDGYPHLRVVLRSAWDRAQVAVISGGGSGHEPAHAGFVGAGMLTAAVCGDVFASPSVDAILAGIMAVTGPAGCLLIVKNYTGDRLNFGLAAERARAAGLKVSMVMVGDDIALPDLPQPRGVAGTLFVHKIAGALAARGADLARVTAAAQKVAAGVRSIGVALDTCRIPGSPKEQRIPDGKAELGLGIHGEAGVEQIAFTGAHAAVAAMIDRLAPRLGKGRLVALINNLGGLSELEMAVIASEVLASSLGGRISHCIGPGALMTAIDMRGFSLSLYAADDEELALLQDGAAPPAWPGVRPIGPVTTQPVPQGVAAIAAPPSRNDMARAIIVAGCEALIAAEHDLNALDAQTGDGDTGATLAHGARGLLAGVDRLPLADPPALLRAISQELTQTMGGSSGVLLAILFAAAGEAMAKGAALADALQAGLARMQEIGGAHPGDRTMVDAMAPAFAALSLGVDAAAAAARAGADRTAAMTQAGAGRAAYLNATQLAGHVDPGAEAVARLLAQLARGVVD